MIPFGKDPRISQSGPFDPLLNRLDPNKFDIGPIETPAWFPPQLIIKLGPGMNIIPDRSTAPYGLSAAVLKLILSLRKDGLLLLETLWSVGVSPYEQLAGAAAKVAQDWAKSNLTAAEYELFWQMLNQVGFAPVQSLFGLNYSSAELKTEARQYLLLRFANRAQLDPAIAKIQTWPGLNLAYVHKVSYSAPPIDNPEPLVNFSISPAMKTKPSEPAVNWPLVCIGYQTPKLNPKNPESTIENIAVLDTGIDTLHPYLSKNVWTLSGYNLLPDPLGHGTRVCGVICSSPPAGPINGWPNGAAPPMTGMLPSAKVLVCQVFGPDPLYKDADKSKAPWHLQISTLTTLLQAFAKGLLAPKIKVLNMSFGSDESDPSIYDHILKVKDKFYIVAAAGNVERGKSNVLYPAAYQGVISVGGLSDSPGYKVTQGTRTNKPNVFIPSTGMQKPLVKDKNALIDIFAPGEQIRVCNPTINIGAGTTHVRISDGTSFAAPIVSAAIAYQLSWSTFDLSKMSPNKKLRWPLV